MGWCHEFGAQVHDGCEHPMRAGATACQCEACGFRCDGRFPGCELVWARGPRDVELIRPPVARARLGTAAGPAAAGDVTPRPANDVPDLRDATVPGPGDPPFPAAPVPAPAADGRGEVLEWLRAAFQGVTAELRTLGAALDETRSAMAKIAESGDAAQQLVRVVEALPARVGAAVAEAVEHANRPSGASAERPGLPVERSGRPSDAPRAGARPAEARPGNGAAPGANTADELRQYLAEVHASAAELRNEMTRLAAFREALAEDMPSVAEAVDAASARASSRLNDLARRVGALAERPEWDTALRSLDDDRAPGGNRRT